jgi:hypothetical protein
MVARFWGHFESLPLLTLGALRFVSWIADGVHCGAHSDAQNVRVIIKLVVPLFNTG